MHALNKVAPAFVDMAHRIVWCSAASVDAENRPRARVLHPIWAWDGTTLTGWIATRPTPTRRAHLGHSPHLSLNYWAPSQDTCVAECHASWAFDRPNEVLFAAFDEDVCVVGVGRALMSHIEAWGSGRFDALQLFTDTNKASVFYESLGYARVTQDHVSHAKAFIT